MLHAGSGTQFEVTDADGIHQVQLIVVPTNEVPPSGYEVSGNEERNEHSWKKYKEEGRFMLQTYYKVDGEEQTVIELPGVQAEETRIQIIDMHGNITWRNFDLGEDSEQPSGNP
jgi:hypothetical protein